MSDRDVIDAVAHVTGEDSYEILWQGDPSDRGWLHSWGQVNPNGHKTASR